MSILENLDRIETAKQKIKEAIIAKGVKVSDTDKLDSYAGKIASIKGDGGISPFRISPCNFTSFTTDTAIHIRIGEFIADV